MRYSTLGMIQKKKYLSAPPPIFYEENGSFYRRIRKKMGSNLLWE
ncbi:hypothetical protein Gogos_015492 [Gossypium gossypioides]|uniref:Uncharacterized protein n=1 Tax=Gossypium gossypioides TaxID=34282 RepID=A0A7J9C2E9_GOSGO|nr:hypothetical protein [Gossypium gossypioides]